MSKLFSWKPEVTPGNVISWIVTVGGVIAFVVWMQADVKELRLAGERMDRRVTKVEERADRFNDSIAEMKGDIKVIRQMLEARRP